MWSEIYPPITKNNLAMNKIENPLIRVIKKVAAKVITVIIFETLLKEESYIFHIICFIYFQISIQIFETVE